MGRDSGGVRFGVLPVVATRLFTMWRSDGIVLFQVNKGVIENRVAWHTGMQETETIGTPSAIWTWMCADCAMRHNEAFLTDSPGVDIVNNADFNGSGVFDKNTIESSSPVLIRSNPALVFEKNSYGRPAAVHRISPGKEIPAVSFRDADRKPVPFPTPSQKWVLLAFVSAASEDHDSRGQVTIVESAQRQFGSVGLETAVIPVQVYDAEHARNLQYDWNLGAIRLLFDDWSAARALNLPHIPALVLVNPNRKIMWHHDGFTLPGELGLTLRSFLGKPDYAQMSSE
jgi:hypothetical protein